MSASAGLASIIESPCCRHDAARSTGGQHLGQGLVIQLGFIPMSHARTTLPGSTAGGNSTTWNVSHSSYSLVYGG